MHEMPSKTMQKLQVNPENRFSRLQDKKLPNPPEEVVKFALPRVHLSLVHYHGLIYFQ